MFTKNFLCSHFLFPLHFRLKISREKSYIFLPLSPFSNVEFRKLTWVKRRYPTSTFRQRSRGRLWVPTHPSNRLEIKPRQSSITPFTISLSTASITSSRLPSAFFTPRFGFEQCRPWGHIVPSRPSIPVLYRGRKKWSFNVHIGLSVLHWLDLVSFDSDLEKVSRR